MKKIVYLFIISFVSLIVSGCGAKSIGNGLSIVKTSTIKLELKEESNDIYSMKIPNGWKMETVGDYENFGFRLYDPNNPARQIFYYGRFSPLLKSDAGKKAWQQYVLTGWSSSKYLADAYVMYAPTIEEFYNNFDNFTAYANDYGIVHDFPILGDFEVLERLDYTTPMASSAEDEGILRLSLKQNNVPCEALVTATVVDAMSYPYYAGGVDTGYYTVYVVSGIMAPADEYDMLEQILSESLSSFTFNEEYVNKGVEQNKWETKVALQIGQMLSKAYDSYNTAWWARRKTLDAIPQKLSDQEGGYVRVYDPASGKVYRMDETLYDSYNDNRSEYKNQNLTVVDDTNSYLYSEPLSGIIR